MESLIDLLANQEKTLQIIRNLASYVIYMYPGIISIIEMNFLEAKNTKETKAFVIKMFAISYMYNITLERFINYKQNEIVYNLILLVMAFIIPFVIYKIKYSKCFLMLCSFLGIRTCITSVPFELLKDKEEQFTCLKVYLKESQYHYIGYMRNYEYEAGKEKYIILTGYIKAYMDQDEEKIIWAHPREAYMEKVYIRYDDVFMIEKMSEQSATKVYNKLLDSKSQEHPDDYTEENEEYDALWSKSFNFNEDLEYELYKRVCRKGLSKKKQSQVDDRFDIKSHCMWKKHIKEEYCLIDQEGLEEFEKFIEMKILKHDSAIFSINTISGGFAGASVAMLFRAFEMIKTSTTQEIGVWYVIAVLILIFLVIQFSKWYNANEFRKKFYEECRAIIKSTQVEFKNEE